MPDETTPAPARGLGADDDAQLAARIAGRDERAFVIVYDRYADLVFGTTLRFVRDRDAAFEIVQDAFMSVWRRGHQYDPRSGSLAGWILGIARHRAIDHLRAEGRRPKLVEPSRPDHDPLDGIDAIGVGVAGSADDTPGIALDRRWLRSLLRTTLAEMPSEERHVVILAYDRGLSQSEIADRLAIPIGTVKSRTRRALAGLRDRLADVPDLRPGDVDGGAGFEAGVVPRAAR